MLLEKKWDERKEISIELRYVLDDHILTLLKRGENIGEKDDICPPFFIVHGSMARGNAVLRD